MASCSDESLKWMYLVNHVFLPPKLPQEADNNAQFEHHLATCVLEALNTFKACLESPSATQRSAIDAAINATSNLIRVHHFAAASRDATISTVELQEALTKLCQTGPPVRAIPIKVADQNAGILAYRLHDSLYFEMFELSAQNNTVTGTSGRLRRKFPGVALSIPIEKVDSGFIETLSRTLERMSGQVVPSTIPTTKKDGRFHEEIRDTAHPMMVTELLVAFMLPHGQAADVTSICKHTRDEVLWKNCKIPWRRSSMWLLIRVSIHLIFLRSGLEAQDAWNLYKQFTIFLAARIIIEAGPVLMKDPTCTEWCDLVYVMKAKVSRRLLKLEKPLPKQVQHSVHHIMTHGALKEIWDSIKREAERSQVSVEPLRSLDFEADTIANLPRLNDFIEGISKRHRNTMRGEFVPHCPLAEIRFSNWSGLGTPTFLAACMDNALSDLQEWTDEKSQVALSEDPEIPCADLWRAMQSYRSTVQSTGGRNPEAWSLMVLGVLELWVACDQLACRAFPILRDYDPDIDSVRLRSLILPFRSQMEKLRVIEEYISKRKTRGVNKDFWTSYGMSTTFAVRYFDQSPNLQSLRQRIEECARQERNTKVAEFKSKKAQYSQLMHEVSITKCDEMTQVRDGFEVLEHAPWCTRCARRVTAEGISISIHEWPLPLEPLELKTVLFELQTPKWFSVWRQATCFIRFDILKCSYLEEISPGINSNFPLMTNVHLSRHFTSYLPCRSVARIGLLSKVKPNSVTHYRSKEISSVSQVENLFYKNASRYHYYDSSASCFTGRLSPTEGMEDLARSMTYSLPSKSSSIQKFIHRPPISCDGPSPNTVVASQSECPSHLSLTEYKALCTIPLGHRIQWQNILLQVTSPSVDFKKPETSMVILQSMHQAGLRGVDVPWHRDSHEIPFSVGLFGEQILKGLREATERIEDNWRCVNELGSYIAIARRILSLAASDDLRREAMAYLSKAREIGLHWVEVLKCRVDSVNDGEKCKLRSRVAHAALVCADSLNLHGTLDTNEDVLDLVLQSGAGATHFIQCCITIQECYPPNSSTDDLESILYWRWQQLCVRAYPILYRLIVDQSNDALDIAIKHSWVSYNRTDSDWAAATSIKPQYGGATWLTAESVSRNGGQNLVVHYCLVTGELRVNGLPLNRLPAQYEAHPQYTRLFGSSALEVMPGDVPGMVFSSKKLYAGHEVHFGLSKDPGTTGDLLVRAVKDGRAWEFVDPKRLYGFPVDFTSGYVHWYDLASNTIEFRPLGDPWTASDGTWKLVAKSHGEWQLRKGQDRILVAPRILNQSSQTSTHMDAIFSPLVNPKNLHLVYRPSRSLLDIELPKLKLTFHLEKGSDSIQSRQFRGMSIDTKQEIGTLVGFENKLILKGASDDTNRKAILVEGPITFTSTKSHMKVSISKDAATRAHACDVDTRLGRLVDNGSLESKLLICYLHALTSFCLPDPLTGRTGTEQALDILDSAAIKSFPVLSKDNVGMLKRIADLTPLRDFYPEHLQVMQSISWSSNLGFLAQHNRFFRAVTSLFESVTGRAFFYPDQYVKAPKFGRMQTCLVRRDEIRSSGFRVSQYGAEEHTTELDREYPSRDMGQDSTAARNAFLIADYIIHGRDHLAHKMTGGSRQIWKYLQDAAGDPVLGSQYTTGRLQGHENKPEYDALWLLDSHHKVLRQNLVLYHDALSRGRLAIDKFDAVIWLSTLAFSKSANLPVVQFVASFLNVHAISLVDPPKASQFVPAHGHTFDKDALFRKLNTNSMYCQFQESPEYQASKNQNQGNIERKRTHDQYLNRRREKLDTFINCAWDQWPCSKPDLDSHEKRAEWMPYIKIKSATAIVNNDVKIWFNNYQLEQYLAQIFNHLPPSGHLHSTPLPEVKRSASKTRQAVNHRPGFISKAQLFCCPPPELGLFVISHVDHACTQHLEVSTLTEPNSSSGPLNALIQQLISMADAAFKKNYVESLRQSANSLASRNFKSSALKIGSRSMFDVYLADQKRHSEGLYSIICDALYTHMFSSLNLARHGPNRDTIDGFSTYWPRFSPSFLLRCIARGKWKDLPPGWKDRIVRYAVSLAAVQRAERMVSAVRRNDLAALSSELQNVGHKNWDPLEYPDSLLLEVESRITIRDVQEEIASHMRSPPDSKNAVMQLNMGEGKSSVIVPIVASAMADGTRLVRVLVAKPQSKQMLQMLTSKLGGLLDRVVFQMPFSRSLQVTLAQATSIRRMLEMCRDVGGVLLVQPEHILSFQQMGTEYAMSEDRSTTSHVLNLTRHFLFDNARDIVDESDENFSVKFELVYTMGPQQSVDHSPQRWRIIQEILGIIRTASSQVKRELPNAIEIHDSPAYPGSFPRTRVLNSEAMQSMLEKLVTQICENGISGFPISRQTPAVREAVRVYITKNELTEGEIRPVEREGPTGFWSDTVRPTLVLIRGLVAHDVLGFALMQKRWRVNYGLAPNRSPVTRLAVPYQAKDQPSARSEFSHPDVVIILTYLTYYYSGLTDSDLFLTFDHLLKSDQAEVEYGLWVREILGMPEKFKTLAGVNIEDKDQCIKDVFPHIRYSKSTVDYFLDHVVFPKEMKEFPSKLSASGWDLGEKKVHPTTGFSGTNDSRRLLPLGMEQLDLEEQSHTNALVMGYLLQPETSVTDIPPRSTEQESDADALLDLVIGLDPPVRVILDVGAQVLELGNLDVARQWLQKTTDGQTQAVVFFDENDELSVVDRSGYIERLQTSPFASQLDACLVFLDEAHTRGTDLRLPSDYRAAVTLGANQTKDGLMQGCMRMRKLGHGQSVVFCVPREIRTKIKELLPCGGYDDEITVSDILIWSIRETWTTLQRGVQLWAAQGWRHQKHQRLWNKFTDGKGPLTASQAEEFLEDEAQTILQRYRPGGQATAPTQSSEDTKISDPIWERLGDFGARGCDVAALYEEQERELATEIETERDVERPPPTLPAEHRVHEDIEHFVRTGEFVPASKGYEQAFTSLRRTRAGREFGTTNIPSKCAANLRVSTDFAQTVKFHKTGKAVQDLYLRSVQWLLVNQKDDVDTRMLIISPYEANALLPVISEARNTTLHIYCPRVNLAFPSLDDLGLFAYPRQGREVVIPQPLRVGLDLFAGQLYFNDYAMYIAVCRFLGISWEKAKDDEVLDSDGFILRDVQGRTGGESGFKKSPVKFIKDLMLLRRDSQGISRTHVGDMLDNRPLSEESFDES
ncbi:uncharacterized protein DNG_04116 [Cephalotrichum gorgonifer]|uniref:ubiquitinyl hydrolase 1 n=1 Tax=Cephalotrichum gorgonifer TaxID=2041049 RepID=A0AAE8MXC9_9PEZI|nr:uncharacterized protein DNG_04116 [Cephalotrichum gorgonifer]